MNSLCDKTATLSHTCATPLAVIFCVALSLFAKGGTPEENAAHYRSIQGESPEAYESRFNHNVQVRGNMQRYLNQQNDWTSKAAEALAESEAAERSARNAEYLKLQREKQEREDQIAAEQREQARINQARVVAFREETYRKHRDGAQYSDDDAYQLCLIHLGVHPQFPPSASDVRDWVNPTTARSRIKQAISDRNTLVIALVWEQVVAGDKNSRLLGTMFNFADVDWRMAINPPDGSFSLEEYLDDDWMRASISDRVLERPALSKLHPLALKAWQRDISAELTAKPKLLDRMRHLYEADLPTRLLAGHSDTATGAAARLLSQCLIAYGIYHTANPDSLNDLAHTRRAVALAPAASDPYAAHVIYSLVGDDRSQSALRAALEEKPPSAACIRRALTLASEDPELIRRRVTDPDLLAPDASIREITKYAMVLASLERPFSAYEDNDSLASTLADLAARSLFQKELTAAIPHLVDKAKKGNCELLAMQLGLIEAGLQIKRGEIPASELPRLRNQVLKNIPGNKLPYDALLTFTPEQAAACLKKPETHAAVLDIVRALAGYKSEKAATALVLSGNSAPKANTSNSPASEEKPTELPL